jgi:fucose permease
MGFSERRANSLVAGFWLTFLASRLGAAYFEYYYIRNAEAVVVITLACLAAVAIAGLAGTYHRPHAILWLLLIGLALGPIFPNLVGILFRHFGDREIGTAFGTAIILGVSPSLIFPPIMTTYASRTTLRVALRLPTLLCILLACGSLALALSR